METNTLFAQGAKPIGICSDHAGFDLKENIVKLFDRTGVQYIDYGTHSCDSTDYPDFAHKMGKAMDAKEIDMGVAICGTGNGINMTMNKHLLVRSALCWNTHIAKMARAHNNANVLALPGREISTQEGLDMVTVFFNTQFEGGRHQGRIDKIPC